MSDNDTHLKETESPPASTTITRYDEFGRAIQIVGPKADWPDADFFGHYLTPMTRSDEHAGQSVLSRGGTRP